MKTGANVRAAGEYATGRVGGDFRVGLVAEKPIVVVVFVRVQGYLLLGGAAGVCVSVGMEVAPLMLETDYWGELVYSSA
jgi:hypothetical protein